MLQAESFNPGFNIYNDGVNASLILDNVTFIRLGYNIPQPSILNESGAEINIKNTVIIDE